MELDGRPVTPDELGALGLYNYGHFTSMRVEEDGRVRGLSLHLDRLRHDCQALHGVDLDLELVRRLARRAVATVTLPRIVRVTVFDPTLDLAHPGADAHPRILVSTRPASTGALPPLKLRSVHYERELPEVKHVGLFGTMRHRRAAQLDGYDDVVFADAKSRISEGATWNVAFLRDGKVLWPQSDWLPGVTMRLVTEVMERNGIEFETVEVTLHEIGMMEAAFITNAAIGVRPIRSIDGVDFTADLPAIDLLQREYMAIPGDTL
ncbi:aminotransferase class IV family protein [Streptosporangium sp. NBC_01810]|uniref:aminotransferase class IV family protein n=1 Tax=Streptosporangium sp. NBC_01810 TaxID=2975951 RepID=UPI002DDA136C|nr:aminotransferase class IV family protein [Streptosporangium sp. NBC_01810]WSA25409.1 aminotransferase class IV family protein [Streptosporangium sp. NBC_01810]